MRTVVQYSAEVNSWTVEMFTSALQASGLQTPDLPRQANRHSLNDTFSKQNTKLDRYDEII